MNNLTKYVEEAIDNSVKDIDKKRINLASLAARQHLAKSIVDRVVWNDFVLELLKYRLVKANKEEKGVWTNVRRSLLQFFGGDL